MAKTIKFNLICNNTSVRSLEDLQENFCVDDILPLYENGLLQRWLDVRGYQSELQKVKEITSTNKYDIITNIAVILGVEQDKDKIEADLAYFRYLDDKKNELQILSKCINARTDTIREYYRGYLTQIRNLINCKENASITKNIVNIIAKDYAAAFNSDYYRIFLLCWNNNLLALMCLLMNSGTRKYYIPDNRTHIFGKLLNIFSTINSSRDHFIDADFDNLYHSSYKDVDTSISDSLKNLINDTNNFSRLEKELGKNLFSYNSTTDQYWKDLEPKGQKVMLINGGYGTKYRGSGEHGNEEDASTIAGQFPIIDGLDYMNNYKGRTIWWMEV